MIRDKVFRFKQTEVPRQAGEFARLRVIKGPDVGATFVIKESSFTLGRGDTVDIILADSKASRTHARIDFTHEGWITSDLGSANGIFYQGEYVRKFKLKSGEHFTLGESVLEFLMSRESNRVLSAPVIENQEVEKQDVALAQQKVRVRNLAQPVKVLEKPGVKKRSPLLLVLGAVAVGAYMYPEIARPILLDYNLGFLADYLPGTPSVKPKTAKASGNADKSAEGRDVASYLPAQVSRDVEKTSEQYFVQGFREYTAGNYIRAKESFELALQVNPNHGKARFYLANAEKENTDEIKRLINAGKFAKRIGKTKQAKGYYETAIRHLYFDRNNPDYIECEEALKDMKTGDEP